MFYEQRTSTPGSVDELRSTYDAELARIVEDVGLESATTATDVDPSALESLLAGDSPTFSLEEAAEILALAEGEPDAETIVLEACDHLLLGMSTAVLDVETLASLLEIDREPRDLQQKIERRAPMTFEEYVHVQYVIAERSP